MGIVRLVLKDVLLLAGAGIVIAIPVALIATKALKSLLFGVSGTDPVVYALAILLITAVVTLAAALAARHAANIEPMDALRHE